VNELSGVVIGVFSERHAKASHLQAEDPCPDESAIIMRLDTKKKDAHTTWKYTIIRHAMSLRLVEGGLARVAGQSCLAGPSVLRLHPYSGYTPGWGIVRESRAESQAFFCALCLTRRVSASIPTSPIPSLSTVALVKTEYGEGHSVLDRAVDRKHQWGDKAF